MGVHQKMHIFIKNLTGDYDNDTEPINDMQEYIEDGIADWIDENTNKMILDISLL